MNRQRPRLRNGVDLQLQSAFHDGNWSAAMRLAEKRARTFNDQYFDIVKLCAESQIDDPASKFAAVAAVDKFVKDGTVVKDVDGVDLLDWATAELIPEDAFSETIGILRVRCAKASPKDKISATRCLESCLLHWDLSSAQQIAALIDRSLPQERDFMFWNIVITHLLAKSEQSPAEKKKLYGTLAQRQVERAAQLTEQAHAAQSEPQARSIKTEEEILLLYDVVESHGTADDVKRLLDSPVFSPAVQFRMGRKGLFQHVASRFQHQREWELLCNLCKDCLSVTDENGEPNMLASDWSVWKQFIDAAAELKSSNTEATTTVQDMLLKLAKSKNLTPIYRRNVLLARVLAAFKLGNNDAEDMRDGQPSSNRLRELLKYIEHQKTSAALFDDLKECLELLDFAALEYISYSFSSTLAESSTDDLGRIRANLLSLKMRYFLNTCPISRVSNAEAKPSSQCAVCGDKFSSECCSACLTKISEAALKLYTQDAKGYSDNVTGVYQDEILPELAIVVAFCNIKLAYGSRSGYVSSAPASSQPLIKALFILEHQLFLTPKHSQICLLLSQMHLLLGSAHRAREVWDIVDVKRTIVDSLAPIFYDRLSTVSPIVLDSSDNWGWQLVENLRGHFATSLKLRMPRRLIDAFEAGSYGSILEIPKYIENLRRGCTRAMSLVEEVRADRLLGEPCGEFLNDPRYYEVPDELVLTEVVDYGSFPSWECSSSKPIHERLRLGPMLENNRSHVSLLVEAFQDILSYRPPTVYKPGSAVLGIEQTFVVEMMSQLGNSMSKFLRGAACSSTSSEMIYYEAVHLLATLVPLCVGINRTAPLSGAFSQIADAVKAAMDGLRANLPKLDSSMDATVTAMRSLHSLAMLRDTAMATKLATQWILAFNEREKERDRSGSSNLPKEVVTHVKGLQLAAEAALKEGKSVVATLKGELGTGPETLRKLRKWVFKDVEGQTLDSKIEDGTVKELVESWRQNITGWGQVKWE